MKYEVQANLLRTFTRQFAQPIRRPVALLTGFCILFVLIILNCTFSPTRWLVFGLIAGIIIFVLTLKRPHFALLLVFLGAGLSMPKALTPLPVHPVRPIEWALLLCVITISVLRLSVQLRPPHLLALLFLAISIVSFAHVPDISSDYYSSSKRLFELILTICAFFCGTILVRYVKDASSFLIAVLLTNIPAYLIGLGQALRIPLPSVLEYSFAQTLPSGRIMGPTSGALVFASYLLNPFAIALACWMLGMRSRDRTIGAIMTVATILEIVWTGTRGSLIAISVVFVVACIFTGRFKMLLGTLVPVGIAVTIFFNNLQQLLFNHNDDQTRLFLWQEGIKLIAAHPWIGIGLYQFPKYYNEQLIVPTAIRLAPSDVHVHEQYLGWALESGIPCLIVAVWLQCNIVFSCWKAYRLAHRKQQVLLLAGILAVLANMVAGIFDQPLLYPENAVFLFLLAGMAVGYAGDIF